MRLPQEEGAQPLRHSWSESERFMPRTLMRPAQRFMQVEAAGGLVMLAAAVVALAWANSPWQGGYEALWQTPMRVEVGSLLDLDLSLADWVNDGAMTLFFLVVGLEIKRELVMGDLRDPRAAALPAIAAAGGMIVPALIYLAFNAGRSGSGGWGIPMATDIAFSVGVVSLLSGRVPSGAKLFLLTLAIVDDLGAIVVIAVFYTGDLAHWWLAVAMSSAGLAAAPASCRRPPSAALWGPWRGLLARSPRGRRAPHPGRGRLRFPHPCMVVLRPRPLRGQRPATGHGGGVDVRRRAPRPPGVRRQRGPTGRHRQVGHRDRVTSTGWSSA